MATLSRSALTIATATAVTVASLYYLRHPRRNKDGVHKPAKDESDDDKTAATSTSSSTIPSELVLPIPSRKDSKEHHLSKPPAVHVRSISRTREDITVILCTDQGHTIEGTILSKKDISKTDAVVVSSVQVEVADETKVLTFSMVEEGEEESSEEPSQDDDDDKSLEPDVSLFFPKVESKLDGPHSSLIRSMEDSDNVIMISPEDMAMMEQLMLQMDDDDELFDCGDEMGRRR
jgi:hypothetical protein